MIYLPIEYLRCFQFNTILDCAPANTLDHISWYKHARILKVVVSISIPTSNIRICIVSHLRQLLDLLKFLIFANTVDLKCYPVTVLICILLLLIILRIFLLVSGVFVFVLLWKGNADLYLLSIFYVAICFARIFYEIIHCFFRCLSPSIKL